MSNSASITAEVRGHHGAPALFINGRPHTALSYYAPDFSSGAGRRRHRQFVEAGVHLISLPTGIAHCAGKDAPWDFSDFDRKMATVLETDPQALLLPRVGIVPGQEWFQANPGEAMLYLDPATGKISDQAGCGGGVAFSSRPWRAVLQPIIEDFVRHAEERYGANMAGYHLSAGGCGEWSYQWGGTLSEYSPAQLAAFRAWLRRRYPAEAELRRAWSMPEVAFDTAEIPRVRVQPPGGLALIDPAKFRPLTDYLEFHSEVVAEAVLDFCAMTKAALARIGRRKLCGVFYGYYFWDAGYWSFHDCGHHAIHRTLLSPDVDFICGPYCYQERFAGGQYHAQMPAESLRLHNKLLFNEDDSRTHLLKPETDPARARDCRATAGMLRRNLAGALADGGTQWWMDLISAGWFEDPELMREIAAMVRLAEDELTRDRAAAAEVAVIVSEEAGRYLWAGCELSEALIARQLSELSAMGLPFLTCAAGDLGSLFESPAARAIKLAIFMNCAYFTPEQRAAIKGLAARDGRTLLWLYAAGLIDEQGLSLPAMEELTGIKAGMDAQPWPCKAVCHITGDRITYGTDMRIAPILFGKDPDCLVHGWSRGLCGGLAWHAPALMEKEMAGWRSVWSAVPALPAAALREIARRAGAHVYVENGDQVLTTRNLLAVHAAHDGRRRVRLPRALAVRDAFSGALVTPSANFFECDLRRGDTGIWRLSAGEEENKT